MAPESPDLVEVGRITGLYGVRGWVRVASFTDPVTNLLNYNPWYLERGGRRECFEVLEGKPHGAGLVVHLERCPQREDAAALVGAGVAIPRAALPALEEGEYYWADLLGLRVVTLQGQTLGQVDHLMETGANDVMVVTRSDPQGKDQTCLVPFLRESVVRRVDLENRVIEVDWDPAF